MNETALLKLEPLLRENLKLLSASVLSNVVGVIISAIFIVWVVKRLSKLEKRVAKITEVLDSAFTQHDDRIYELEKRVKNQ